MRGPPAGGGGQGDNSTGIIWGIAALFAVMGVVWYVFQTQLVRGYLFIKLQEVNFMNSVTGNRFDALHEVILSAIQNPKNVTFSMLMQIGGIVGDWTRYPLAVILFILAIAVYFGNKTRTFRRVYSMTDLAKLEQVNWPQITPVINLDLLKQDIDKGPWAMAMTPMQFCKRYRLLEEVKAGYQEGISRKERDRIHVILKRGEANRIFALQLGAVWQGIDKLPPYTKALLAVFAARYNADTKAAVDILYRLSASSTGQLDYTGVDDLLKKHIKTEAIQQMIQSHAYVLTVMATLLEAAREDGVQASADFLWLKPLDRRLWYMLNTVGRQTPFVEVGGPFAHWIAEKEAGRKILVPMVEEASKALELALKEVVYKPDSN
jgi:intracellular multiplication protein IcmP